MTCLPSHHLPFPWYPFKQEQRYDPLVLIHSAFWWQSWTPSAHSSISLHDVPSPWKPKLQLQVWEPCVLMQRAFRLHLSVPSVHSLMSKQKWDGCSLVWSLAPVVNLVPTYFFLNMQFLNLYAWNIYRDKSNTIMDQKTAQVETCSLIFCP